MKLGYLSNSGPFVLQLQQFVLYYNRLQELPVPQSHSKYRSANKQSCSALLCLAFSSWKEDRFMFTNKFRTSERVIQGRGDEPAVNLTLPKAIPKYCLSKDADTLRQNSFSHIIHSGTLTRRNVFPRHVCFCSNGSDLYFFKGPVQISAGTSAIMTKFSVVFCEF